MNSERNYYSTLVRMALWTFLVCSFAGVPSLLAASGRLPRTADVCDVLRRPERFVGKDVSIRGPIVASEEHGVVLVATACRIDASIWKGGAEMLVS